MAYNTTRLKGILATQTKDFYFSLDVTISPLISDQFDKLNSNKELKEKIDKLTESLWCGNVKKDSIIDIYSKRKYYSRQGYDIPEATHKLDCSDETYEYWSKDISIKDRFVYRLTISTDIIEIVNISGHFDYKTIEKLEISKTFSEEVLAEREEWIRQHSHLSPQSRNLIMPLRFKYPDIKGPSEKFKEALAVANEQIVKTVRKPELPTVEPLTVEELLKGGIRGTLMQRKGNKSWTVTK